LPPVEPWPQPVDGADLLTETTAAILRYMVMPDGTNGQRVRPPTPPADASASIDAQVEETAPPLSLVPDPASDPPKETAASSPALAAPDLDDIAAFLDRLRKSALADASAR
jgi:hypothetical protein